MFFDALELLKEEVTEDDAKILHNRYDGHNVIFGAKNQHKI